MDFMLPDLIFNLISNHYLFIKFNFVFLF